MNASIGAPSCHSCSLRTTVETMGCFLQSGLNCWAMELTLPTVVSGALILKQQGKTADLDGLQTNSMMAISALSPRRRTVRMIRV